MDCCQPAASFKIRGIGKLCVHLAQSGIEGIVCASGGNAGYAAAWSAKALGLRCRIVLPHSSPGHLEGRLQALNAEVLRHGAHWQEAHEWASASAAASGEGYVHPFDHPLIHEGHASVIEEALDSMNAANARVAKLPPSAQTEVPSRFALPSDVLVAVGGGGLLAGVLIGLKRAMSFAPNGTPAPRVWAVETHGAASMHAALKARVPVTLEGLQSRAHSLGALRVSSATLDLALEYGVQSLLVSDDEAIQAAHAFARAHRHGIEMASGTVLAALNAPALADRPTPLCIVCGGLDALWPGIR
jgi:L-serine/L-threonine ammonia-lyase